MCIEEIISRSLRAVLADLPVGTCISDSAEFRTVLSGLDGFIPEVIGEIHPEMLGQIGDGVLPIVAHKTGDGELEILGHFCFIADQKLTPLHIKIQVAEAGNSISWLECCLGERGEGGMVRTPYSSPGATTRLLNVLARKAASIDWYYKVAFGERRVFS